jgi:4-amino-4-deoxy-L-arabinose transferase-like glycosyltransferase
MNRLTVVHSVVLWLLLALPAAGLSVSRGFDGLYGQDAYAYFDYATASVRQSILHLAPLEAFFWPPGYPLLAALASLIVGPSPLAGQAVSLVMGALVPVFTALLVREIWPDEIPRALLAGALVALCGQLWQSSIVVMADTTGLALATLGAWVLARYARHGRLAWLTLAAACLAYATLTRWIYGLVGIPFAAYALSAMLPRGATRAMLHAAAALAVAAALLVPVLGPPLLGLLSRPADPAAFAGNLQVYSWSPLNAFGRDFFTADGHLSYALPNGVYYAIAPANFAFFGPFLAPCILLGLWAAVREWQRPWLVLIVGWAGVVFAFHAGAPWQNFRFSLAYLPPLAILVASGLTWAWQRVGHRLRVLVGVWAVLGLVIMAAGGVRLVQGFVDRKADDLALVRWVETQAPPSARIFSFGPTLTFRHYARYPTIDLYDVTPADLASVLATPAPTYVLLDEANVEHQWLGAAPYANFRWLADGPGLVRIGGQGSYTLFLVGSAR